VGDARLITPFCTPPTRVISIWFGLPNMNGIQPDSLERWSVQVERNMSKAVLVPCNTECATFNVVEIVLREVGLSDSSSIELESPSRCSVCIVGLLQSRRQSPACLPYHRDTIQTTGTSRRRGDDVDNRLGLRAVTETGGPNRKDQTPIRVDGALRASGCPFV